MVVTEKYSILYDADTDIIRKAENYDNISLEELRKYCEYKSNCKLSISEYRSNVDKLIKEYENIISHKGLKKIIEEFPKKKNGQFKKRTVILAKSMNAIRDMERKSGYIHGNIVATYEARRVLKIKYVKSYSIV